MVVKGVKMGGSWSSQETLLQIMHFNVFIIIVGKMPHPTVGFDDCFLSVLKNESAIFLSWVVQMQKRPLWRKNIPN